MNASKSLFHVARVTFGLGHLVFQTAADLCIEAEVACVKHTGFEDSEGNMRMFGDEEHFTERNYKIGRGLKTRATQRKAVLTLEQARAKVLQMKKSGKIRNNLNVA